MFMASAESVAGAEFLSEALADQDAGMCLSPMIFNSIP